MTENEAHAQAFENGRKVGDAEGYARGKAEAFAESGDSISRKALLDEIAETAEGLSDCDQQNAAWALRKYAIRDIENAPTVDAVEVVRCKDCKHWHKETGWCTKHSHFIGRDGMACHPSQSSEWKMLNADDFCSYGERRDDNGQTER